MALFPMPDVAVSDSDLRVYGTLLDKLAADGWVEKLPADESHDVELWVTAHDVLADQVLLSYLKSIPQTVERFIRELFSLARRVNCLDSALITLQRLADHPLLSALEWSKILDAELAEEPATWREVRNILIRTPLLTAMQRIKLIGEHEEVWKGAEEEVGFQNSLGWLARWALARQEPLNSLSRSILVSWIQRAARWVRNSNFVLTWGIRFCPEAVQDSALNWIVTQPVVFQTHYLLVAWLDQGLPQEAIALPVQQWATKFKTVPNLSFLIRAWLNAGGDKGVVQGSMLAWLDEHKTDADAGFVYNAWLKADGDKGVVQDAIAAWLDEHKTDADAGFVYGAWLDASGDKSVVRAPIAAWLDEHKTDARAGFVYRTWLYAGGDKGVVQDAIAAWLDEHKTDADAGFIYNAWLNAGGDKGVVQGSMLAWVDEHKTDANARFVYGAWLKAGGDKGVVQDAIAAWLDEHKTDADAQFVYDAWLDAGGDKDVVQDSILAWVDEHKTDANADFVYKAWLDADGDKNVVKEFLLLWLSEHGRNTQADFLYKAWLKAGGEFSMIRSLAIQWLSQNYEKAEAVYLTKYLAKQANIPIETVKDILRWCQKFPHDEDALWRLRQLGKHLLREEIAEEVCITSEAVISPLISQDYLKPVISSQITTLISYLIEHPDLRSGQFRARVDALFLTCLRNPASFGDKLIPHFNSQRQSFVQRMADLVTSDVLRVSADHEPLERFLRWVNNWELDNKLEIQHILESLKIKYPAPGLWDIVQFR